MRQLVYTLLISNNRASSHLWWKKGLVKHQKVSKYCAIDCSWNILSKNSMNPLSFTWFALQSGGLWVLSVTDSFIAVHSQLTAPTFPYVHSLCPTMGQPKMECRAHEQLSWLEITLIRSRWLECNLCQLAIYWKFVITGNVFGNAIKIYQLFKFLRFSWINRYKFSRI